MSAALRHPSAILTVDLDAIVSNYRLLGARLRGARCAAVVKADAYGLGATPVSLALRRAGCADFFVAHAEEGMSLRTALGSGPTIRVLHGLPRGAEPDYVEHDLEPVINTMNEMERWQRHAARTGHALRCAIQVETGMNRLGLTENELETFAHGTGAATGVTVTLLISHLACADEPAHPANERQRQIFARVRALLPEVPASLANSSGIFLGPQFHHDLARPGAALYGINPTPWQENQMHQVARLAARVLRTCTVGVGEGVGYGHAATVRTALTTATLGIGYADGWRRGRSAHAYAFGNRLPVTGRVSMDSMVVDASAVPQLGAGDLVELIGPSQTVDQIAAADDTIGYEILSALGPRIERRYVGNSA